MKKFIKSAEIKAVDDESGIIEGYASVYDVKDLDGDTVVRGAFDDVIESGEMPVMFFGHDWSSVPIGKWTELSSDEHGLKIKGQLNLDIQQSKDIYSALKFGSFKGLSVGFSLKEDDYDFDEGIIKRVDRLMEVSVVPLPANTEATIESVKSEKRNAQIKEQIESIDSLKDLEKCLCDAGGFSNTQSKALISAFKRVSAKAQRDAETSANLKAIADRLASIKF